MISLALMVQEKLGDFYPFKSHVIAIFLSLQLLVLISVEQFVTVKRLIGFDRSKD
jgi:hypothetical protein